MLNTTPMVRNPTTKSAGLPTTLTPKNAISVDLSKGSEIWICSRIQCPKLICNAMSGGWVNGFVTQHAAIETGILTLALMLARAARSI